jgi:hypothetical protein
MAQPQHTHSLAYLEEALTVLFCLIDDTYALLNPRAERYEALKRLSDSEVITLALFQQLRGVESCRSFLRDVQRFFSHLFPGVVGLHPSSLHRRIRKLRRLEWNLCAERSSPSWWEIRAKRVLGDLAYHSEELKEALAEVGILLATPSHPSGGAE